MNFKHEVKKVKCGNPECEKEFYKFTSFDRFCPYHRYEVRKKNIMQQTANKRAIKPIKQISDKRAIKLKEYSKLRKQFLKENPKCAVYPYLPSNEIHHVRGRNGSLLTDTRYFLAVSRVGHQQIEMNPDWAREKGFIETRINN